MRSRRQAWLGAAARSRRWVRPRVAAGRAGRQVRAAAVGTTRRGPAHAPPSTVVATTRCPGRRATPAGSLVAHADACNTLAYLCARHRSTSSRCHFGRRLVTTEGGQSPRRRITLSVSRQMPRNADTSVAVIHCVVVNGSSLIAGPSRSRCSLRRFAGFPTGHRHFSPPKCGPIELGHSLSIRDNRPWPARTGGGRSFPCQAVEDIFPPSGDTRVSVTDRYRVRSLNSPCTRLARMPNRVPIGVEL